MFEQERQRRVKEGGRGGVLQATRKPQTTGVKHVQGAPCQAASTGGEHAPGSRGRVARSSSPGPGQGGRSRRHHCPSVQLQLMVQSFAGPDGERFPLTWVPPKTLQSLTFMSLMMVWKSPPSALHSFSITASIFLTRAHWRRQKPLQFHY